MTALPSTQSRRWRAFFWQRIGPRDILALAGFWTVLSLASLWGWLAPFDGRLFDLAIRALPSEPPAAVAIVRTNKRGPALPVDTWRHAGATRVIDLDTAGLGTFGAGQRFVATDATRCLPPAPDGVVRVLRLRDADGRPCPLAQVAAAAGLQVPAGTLLSPDFTVRTSTSIPRLDAASLPGPTALAIAVGGRIVLRVPAPDALSHVTPLYATDGLLEPSVIYAMALDALVRGRAIRWARPGVDVLAAALATLLLHLLLRRSSYRVTLTVTLLSLVPLLLVLGVALHVGRMYVPGTASVIAIAAFALRALLRRNRALGQTLVDIDHRLTGLVGQPFGQGFELPTGLVWEHANRFVTELFDLRRSVMLELPLGTTHIRPAVAFGCTPADIIEKRRDYRRAPYSTALARELPTPPSRPFLPAEAGVVDLITPLIAADQLVGFWAFSVASPPGASVDTLALEGGRYASEIAKLVLRAGEANAPSDQAARRWPTLERLRGRLLDGANQAREQLAAHRDVFAAIGHPIAVCDLLGRVQFANPAFEQFAEAIEQPLMSLSVTGLLEKECGLTPSTAKQTLRHAMLGTGTEARLPIPVAENETPLALVLRPILRRVLDHPDVARSPFDLLGMIVEIVPDLRSAEDASRMGQTVAQYARRSQVMLDGIARSLDSLGLSEKSHEHLTDLVASGLNDAGQLLRQSTASLGRDAGDPGWLDLQQLLRRIRQGLASQAREKRVEIQLPQRSVPAVAADEEPLAHLLRCVVALLLDDAAPGSTLEIASAQQAGSAVQLRIVNDGYGMPDWHVQDVLRDRIEAPLKQEASPLERLAHAAAGVDGSIRFQLEAELGKGYQALLTIPRAH